MGDYLMLPFKEWLQILEHSKNIEAPNTENIRASDILHSQYQYHQAL